MDLVTLTLICALSPGQVFDPPKDWTVLKIEYHNPVIYTEYTVPAHTSVTLTKEVTLRGLSVTLPGGCTSVDALKKPATR